MLQEKGATVPIEYSDQAKSGEAAVKVGQTPETYLGTRRASDYVGSQRLIQGQHVFAEAALPRVNNWTLGGEWKVGSEGITAVRGATLKIRVAAKEVYLVTGSAAKGSIEVALNGTPIGQTKSSGDDVANSQIAVTSAQLYRVVKSDKFTPDTTVALTVPDGVQLNTFTFGS